MRPKHNRNKKGEIINQHNQLASPQPESTKFNNSRCFCRLFFNFVLSSFVRQKTRQNAQDKKQKEAQKKYGYMDAKTRPTKNQTAKQNKTTKT